MGGLRRYMPITYLTALVGSLALIGFPGFSGFFSKDTIIEAVGQSHVPGAGIAYWLLLLGAFVTAVYTFRLFFLVFHGKERMDDHVRDHLRESPMVVTVPLILLAIPSFAAGYLIHPLLFGHYFGNAIQVLPQHNVLATLGTHYHGLMSMVMDGLVSAPFWISMAGVAIVAYIYLLQPGLADVIKTRLYAIWRILDEHYGFDAFNDRVFAGGARALGQGFWRVGDAFVIDNLVVNGVARVIGWTAARVRYLQTGYLYHYSFTMIIGVLVLLTWFVFR